MNDPMSTVQIHELNRAHERSLAAIVAEVKDEVKEFVNTRVRMIKAELQEGLAAVKVALPLLIAALILGFIALLMFSLAIVVLLASAFPGSPYAWFYGFIIVGGVWIAFAGVSAYFAMNALRSGVFPKHTVATLKADKVWLQAEARSQL